MRRTAGGADPHLLRLAHPVPSGGTGGLWGDRPSDALWGLQKAVCRTTVTTTGESRPSREALTVEEGLEAMTVGAAWMDFQEDSSGRLLQGYRADLLVLSGDPFSCPPERLGTIRPVLTMVDGNLLWSEI